MSQWLAFQMDLLHSPPSAVFRTIKSELSFKDATAKPVWIPLQAGHTFLVDRRVAPAHTPDLLSTPQTQLSTAVSPPLCPHGVLAILACRVVHVRSPARSTLTQDQVVGALHFLFVQLVSGSTRKSRNHRFSQKTVFELK